VKEPGCPLADFGGRFLETCCLTAPMMTVAAHGGEVLPLAPLSNCCSGNQTSRTRSVHDPYFYHDVGVVLRWGLGLALGFDNARLNFHPPNDYQTRGPIPNNHC